MALTSPIKNPLDNLFEQVSNISKAHGYDILVQQVGELKKENEKLRDVLKDCIYDMKEWRDYNVLQVDSFEGNEKQMVIDICRDITLRIEKAEEVIKITKFS